MLSRGFSGSPARVQLLRRSLFLGTLSARDVGSRSTPHGFAYCKSSREQRVGFPAGQCLGCFVFSYPSSSSSVVPWDCTSRLAPARLSRAPRTGCDSPPRPLPGVSPCQTQGVSISLTRLLLVIHNLTLTRNHSSLASSGHTFSG